MLERSFVVQWVPGWIVSRICRRACSGGESSLTIVALSCLKRYSVAVVSLSVACMPEALKVLKLSVGRSPDKAGLVILHVSLEGLGSCVFDRIIVGICLSKVCRILFAMEVGMSVSGIFVVHLACPMAIRSP